MERKIVIGIVFLTLIVFIIGCTEISDEISVKSGEPVVAIADEIQTTSDGTKYLVHPDKIRSGGPPQGGIGVDAGIPALAAENINFVSVEEADEWIEDNELVLALIHKGEKRVYPLQILVWHEIANDVVGGDELAITYCPLCGSGIAYNRKIVVDGEEKVSRFGTSGKLFNSNMVMYDEETNSYWQQIDGKAIVGDLVGQELREVSIDTVVWRDWKVAHPDSEVLSQQTGILRDYGRDPYGNYYEDSFLIFPVENEDNRIHPKTIVFGIEVDGEYKAYQEKDLITQSTIRDVVNEIRVVVERDDVGIVTVTRLDTDEEVVKERDMWFAWYAFHPKTSLYNG